MRKGNKRSRGRQTERVCDKKDGQEDIIGIKNVKGKRAEEGSVKGVEQRRGV